MQTKHNTFQVVGWLVMVSLVFATVGCSGGATKPTTTPPPRAKGELDKVMRTRMNKAYSQLVFLVFHSESDADFAKLGAEGEELRQAVQRVLALPAPPVAESPQAREVYITYNKTLERDTDKFAAAIAQKNLPEMESLLSKIGKTCSDCHRFFRIEVPGEK